MFIKVGIKVGIKRQLTLYTKPYPFHLINSILLAIYFNLEISDQRLFILVQLVILYQEYKLIKENNQSFKLQAKVAEYDLRNPVSDPSAHPYRGIGKVVVKCYDPQKKQFVTQFGTGSIINKNLILTAAHVLYFPKMNVWGNTIEFYPFQYLGTEDDNKLIKITKFYVDQSYLKQKDTIFNLDYAILQLQHNNDIQDDQILQCNLNYDSKDVKKDIINISGYSSQMKVFKNFQFFEESVALYEKKGFLFYKHKTNDGNSGGPLLLKCNSKRYEIIGLHKGACGDKNFGLLLKIFRDKIQKLVSLQTDVKIDSYLENCYFTFYRQNSQANDKYSLKEKLTLQNLEQKLEKKQLEIEEIKAQYNELQTRKNKKITDLKTKLKQLQNKVQQKNKCGYINEFITREKQRQQKYAKIKNLSSQKNYLEYSVGIIISRYPKKYQKNRIGQESQKEFFTAKGNAFYIGRGLLLTAANNLFFHEYNKIPSQVQFVPQVMNKYQYIDKSMRAKSWKVFKNSSDSRSLYSQRFDIGMVLLEESKFYNQNGILNIQWDYNSKSQVDKMFKLVGYDCTIGGPDRLEINDKVLFNQNEFLYYQQNTKSGQGGSPLVIEDENSKDYAQKVIGLHKGVTVRHSYGISFNAYQNPQQIICQLVEELNAEDRFPQYQPSYKKLRQLLELQKN